MIAAILMLAAYSAQADPRASADRQELAGMDAIAAWDQCLIATTDRLLASKETADVLADAVLGSCLENESTVRSAWLPLYGRINFRTAEADTEEAMTRLRKQRRGLLLSRIVTQRAGAQ